MSTTITVKEPLVRISKRNSMTTAKAWGIRAAALALSLVLCGLIIYAIVKMNPVKVYVTMWEGAFGTQGRSWQTVRDTMMLLCIAIGLAPAFKMRFWNIGAEGQVLVGGIATAACMIYGKTLPTAVLFLVMLLTSIAAGALWGLLPAVCRSKWNTNETLFTLMMNYIAIQLTSYCVALWENPYGSNSVGVINQVGKIGWIPKLFGQQHAITLLVVLALTVAMYLYLKKSKQGFEIAVVGDSENTARYAGISVAKVYIRTMLISGGICGLAGFLTVSGVSHTISVNSAGGNGFTAIIVAWMAKFNTFVMIAISLLLVFLEKGAAEIASKYQLNDYASQMITGIILFFILGSEFFIQYEIKLRGRK